MNHWMVFITLVALIFAMLRIIVAINHMGRNTSVCVRTAWILMGVGVFDQITGIVQSGLHLIPPTWVMNVGIAVWSFADARRCGVKSKSFFLRRQ